MGAVANAAAKMTNRRIKSNQNQKSCGNELARRFEKRGTGKSALDEYIEYNIYMYIIIEPATTTRTKNTQYSKQSYNHNRKHN